MRHINLRAVLDLLRRKGALSRVEITQALGCDGTTVTNIVRDLLKHDLVRSGGACFSTKAGRPRELLELNPDHRQVVGLSFDPRFVMGILTNLQGGISVREQVFFDSELSQKELLKIAGGLVERLLSNADGDRLIGIGIGTFGMLPPEEKVITKATHFPAMEGLDMSGFFMKEFNMRPMLVDSTFAKALAEMGLKRQRDETTSDFLLLDIGMGIGCSTVLRGELLCGASGYVGEFGHTVFDINGEECQCGHRGCLETLASIPAIEKSVSEKVGGAKLRFNTIVEKYQAGEDVAVEAVNEAARWMGVGVANLINFLNPAEIILSGRLLQLGESYVDAVRRTVEEFALAPFSKDLEITVSSLGEEGAALGAAELLLGDFFENVEKWLQEDDG